MDHEILLHPQYFGPKLLETYVLFINLVLYKIVSLGTTVRGERRRGELRCLELRHQYSIGYRPPRFMADRSWHRIRVKVMTPQELKRVSVRSREGYDADVSLH